MNGQPRSQVHYQCQVTSTAPFSLCCPRVLMLAAVHDDKQHKQELEETLLWNFSNFPAAVLFPYTLFLPTIWIHKELLDEVRLMRHGEGEVLKLNRADALLALTFLTSHSYNKGKKGPLCFQRLCTFKWIIPSTCLPNDCMSALALFRHIITYSSVLSGSWASVLNQNCCGFYSQNYIRFIT